MNGTSQGRGRFTRRKPARTSADSRPHAAQRRMELKPVPLDFIVVGLPRAGTTWIANWLTTDRSLCLHDPFALGMPEAWPRDGRLRGISCTIAALMQKWLSGYNCPIAIIDRDPKACEQSLEKLDLPTLLGLPSPPDFTFNTSGILPFLDVTPGRRFAFDDLWNEEAASELWRFLLPSVPFDRIRYRLLHNMQVQPMRHDEVDVGVMHRLISAGLYDGEL